MSENLEERYLYTVYPKKPIRNISENLPLLRVPKTLSLNKDEVLKCFDGGSSVYRRFSNEGIVEKINKYELDRVHRAKYISKEKWNTMNNSNIKEENTTDITTKEVDTTESSTENIVEKVEDIELGTSGYIEEVKEETEELSVPETFASADTVEVEIEENTASDEINEEINETIEESSDIDESENNDVVEEGNSESVEEESKTTSKVYVNYGGKKKKHH